MLTADPVQAKQTVANCSSVDQECLSHELRSSTSKLIENLQLRFPDKSAVRDSRICRSRGHSGSDGELPARHSKRPRECKTATLAKTPTASIASNMQVPVAGGDDPG